MISIFQESDSKGETMKFNFDLHLRDYNGQKPNEYFVIKQTRSSLFDGIKKMMLAKNEFWDEEIPYFIQCANKVELALK